MLKQRSSVTGIPVIPQMNFVQVNGTNSTSATATATVTIPICDGLT